MFLIELIKAVLFGIVEGITEWLPISSTGHLILLQDLCSLKSRSSLYGDVQCCDPIGSDPSGCGDLFR